MRQRYTYQKAEIRERLCFDDCEAKNNYWMAPDTDTIDAGIYDDEEGKGKVEFYPFEIGPVPCAPNYQIPSKSQFPNCKEGG